jgi:tRNA(Ile)-lysidine synthase
MLAWRYGIDCPFDRVVAAADFIASGPTGNRFDLGLGVLLCNGRAVTDVVSAAQTLDDRVAPLAVPGVTEAFGRVFSIVCRDEAPSDDLARYCHAARQVFDADAFGAEVSVRHRRPGDRFMPFGMSGTRKIQDYIVDIGLPASQRDAQLLLVAGGRIAWIVGHAISAHAAVTSQTRRFVEIEVRRAHP